MNNDFEKRRDEAYEKIANKKAEIERLKKSAEDAEAELNKMQDDLLLNLSHKEEKKQCEAPFIFMTKIPDAKDFLERKAVVVSYEPDIDGDEGGADKVSVSFEPVDDPMDVCVALALALAHSLVYVTKQNRDPKHQEMIDDVMGKPNIEQAAMAATSAACDSLIGDVAIEALAKLLDLKED